MFFLGPLFWNTNLLLKFIHRNHLSPNLILPNNLIYKTVFEPNIRANLMCLPFFFQTSYIIYHAHCYQQKTQTYLQQKPNNSSNLLDVFFLPGQDLIPPKKICNPGPPKNSIRNKTNTWGAVKIYYNCLVCFWRVIVFWGGPYRFTGFCCFRHHPSRS